MKILVYCDREEMFLDSQIDVMKCIVSDLEIIPSDKCQGLGEQQIESIWDAYKSVAERCTQHDYIARVDSDVFFFSSWIFDLVLKSNRDFIGDGHYVQFQYGQGGLYFLRATAVKKICAHIQKSSMKEVLADLKIGVEDVAVFQFIKRCQLSWVLTWFMMFPDELRRSNLITKYDKWKFSCLHYVYNHKEKMIDCYKQNCLKKDDWKKLEPEVERVK